MTHYLLWKCLNQQNSLIEAPSFGALISTFATALDKEDDALPVRYIVGERAPLDKAIERVRAKSIAEANIGLFAVCLPNDIENAGLKILDYFILCKVCGKLDRYSEKRRRCTRCCGSGYLPINTTWESLYERAQTIPDTSWRGFNTVR